MCDIVSGRNEPQCKTVGGLKKAYFINWVKDAFTIAAGQATAINILVTEVFGWDLRADENNLVEAVAANRNNGTKVNTQTLTLRFKKQDFATSNEIMLMANGRPIIVAVGYDGTHKIVGAVDGCDLTGSNIQSGGAKDSFNGYDLTFTAIEDDLAPHLDAATVTALEALESITVIDP